MNYSGVSEDVLKDIRELIKQEFRKTVSKSTTIVTDCLVCGQVPSPDCPVCKRKYKLSLKSFKVEAQESLNPSSSSSSSVSAGGSKHHSSTRKSSGGNDIGFTEHFDKHRHSTTARSSRRTNHPDPPSNAHETILSLRNQIQSQEVEIARLMDTFDESAKSCAYWKENCKVLSERVDYLQERDKELTREHADMEKLIAQMKNEYQTLLERARLSEACRSQSAKVLARMRQPEVYETYE